MKNKKIKEVFFSVFRQSSIALLGFLFPVLVLKMINQTIWGKFFEVFLFTLICSTIANWGNKEYLLLKFSKKPNLMNVHFSSNFFGRLPLLFLCLLMTFFVFDLNLALWTILWLIGRYLSWSFEVVNQYQKDNFTTSIIEYSSYVLLFILLKITANIGINHLVYYYSMHQFIKGIAYLIKYFKWLKWNLFKFSSLEIKNSLFYFLLAFSGFLVSKMDVFIAQKFFNSTELGRYGILNNFFLFTMSLGNMAILPFIKVLYRKNKAYYSKVKKMYAFFGFFISIVSLVFIYFLNNYYLEIYFEPLFYCIGFLYVFSTYLYGIDVYEKFKEKKESQVLSIFIVGSLFLFASNIVLLKMNRSLLTLLISAAISQWFLVFLFKKDFFRNEK